MPEFLMYLSVTDVFKSLQCFGPNFISKLHDKDNNKIKPFSVSHILLPSFLPSLLFLFLFLCLSLFLSDPSLRPPSWCSDLHAIFPLGSQLCRFLCRVPSQGAAERHYSLHRCQYGVWQFRRARSLSAQPVLSSWSTCTQPVAFRPGTRLPALPAPHTHANGPMCTTARLQHRKEYNIYGQPDILLSGR